MKCFYHNDMDGHAAAAIVAKETKNYKEEDYFEIDYVSPIPIEEIDDGETVYFVDYSFDESNLMYLDEMIEKQCNIIWIDHHKTSIELLDKYPKYKLLPGLIRVGECGALLTYEYFHDRKGIPVALKFINDFDCGYFKYGDETSYFKLGIDSMINDPLETFWKTLIYDKKNKKLIEKIIKKGKSVKMYVTNQNRFYSDNYGYESELDGIKCFCINHKATHSIFGSKLKQYPLCVAYIFNGESFVYSIYTSKKEIDCSKIAAKFGGGGHHMAAGFKSNELLCKKDIA